LGGGRTTQLAWFDRNGAKLANVGPIHPYNSFALSRNGERLALARSDDRDLWLLDIMSGAFTRFTFDNPSDGHPVWSPDGRQIVYSRSEARIFEKTVDGGRERELTGVEGIPYDWSQDGRSILVSSADRDLWVLSEAKATPIMRTPFIEAHGQFSPDGKWLAFTSDESKRQEIYVQAFPNAGEKFLISTAGGSQPRWRSDGNELFYVAPDRKLMAVPVSTGTGFTRRAPVPLFTLPSAPRGSQYSFGYAVAGNPPRFLLRTAVDSVKSSPIEVSLNWLSAAKK